MFRPADLPLRLGPFTVLLLREPTLAGAVREATTLLFRLFRASAGDGVVELEAATEVSATAEVLLCFFPATAGLSRALYFAQ